MEHVAARAKALSADEQLRLLLRRLQTGQIADPRVAPRCQECGEHPADCVGHRPVVERRG